MKHKTVGFIGRPNFSAVRFDDPFADRQPQAGTGDFIRFGDAVEFVEDGSKCSSGTRGPWLATRVCRLPFSTAAVISMRVPGLAYLMLLLSRLVNTCSIMT